MDRPSEYRDPGGASMMDRRLGLKQKDTCAYRLRMVAELCVIRPRFPTC